MYHLQYFVKEEIKQKLAALLLTEQIGMQNWEKSKVDDNE